jgi:endonuclease/exonuclease/phosphatase family metal-dependent hydrolase
MLKLVSVNIERDMHLDRVVPFIEREQPDVVCFQEIYVPRVEAFSERFGAQYVYAPNLFHRSDNFTTPVGIAIFTQLPIREKHVAYYVGDGSTIPQEHLPEKGGNRSIIALDIEKEGRVFRIATTHFTWTPKGEANDQQRRDLQALIAKLNVLGEFVLCGDFNAPRGGEIFSVLARRYVDQIPALYASSIDLSLHRAATEDGERLSRLMVDGLFTTPQYTASDVRLVAGVSDHMAIVASIATAT